MRRLPQSPASSPWEPVAGNLRRVKQSSDIYVDSGLLGDKMLPAPSSAISKASCQKSGGRKRVGDGGSLRNRRLRISQDKIR